MTDRHGPRHLRQIELFDMMDINLKDVIGIGYDSYFYLKRAFKNNSRWVKEVEAYKMFFIDKTGGVTEFGRTLTGEDAEDTVYKMSNLLGIDTILGPVPIPGQ